MPFDPATSFVPSAPTVFASTVAPVVATDGAVDGGVDWAAVEGGAACEAGCEAGAVAGAVLAPPEQAARTRISGSRPAATAMRCRPMDEVPPGRGSLLSFTRSSTSGAAQAVSGIDSAARLDQWLYQRSYYQHENGDFGPG